MAQTLSHIDHAALKRALSGERQAVKTWNYFLAPSAIDAVNFVNADPPQGNGEAVFSDHPDGTVGVYFFL